MSNTTDSGEIISPTGDVSKMEESAAEFVSAVVLLIVSIIALIQIYRFLTSQVYPRAQYALCILFFLPVLIGWISWEHVYTKEKDHRLEKILNLYKAAALFSFMYYINCMLGWTVADGKSYYSDASLERVLMKQKEAHCYLSCISPSPLKTPEDCRKFVRRTNIGVLQMAVLLIVLEFIGIGLLVYDYDLFKVKKSGFFYTFIVIGGFCVKFCSSGIALNYILNYSLFCSKIPEFRDLAIMSKFVILKLALFLTEIQGMIIYGFAYAYVHYYNTSEDVVKVTLYTNSLLLCSEMIICGILQFTIFPLTDFYFHPQLKEKLVKHDAKHDSNHHHKEV